MAGLPKLPEVVDPTAMVDKRTGKPKRISSAVKRAIDLLLTGECTAQKAAAARVGLSEGHLSRAFQLPHVRNHIDARTRAHLSEGKMVAGARLLELVRADSEHVSFDASRHVLAISNIRPPDLPPSAVSVSINNVVAGYVVDLTPWSPLAAEKTVEHIGPAGGVVRDEAAPQAVELPRDIRPGGPRAPDE